MDEPKTASAQEPMQIEWRNPEGLGLLSLKIFFLRIITIGIYHFWGKTEVRRKLWHAIQLNGQPLEYTGRGLEIFLGFLFVFFVVLLPAILILAGAQIAFGPQSAMTVGISLVVYVVFSYLYGVAKYRARRYRLSRTRWRGIRGTMSGSSWSYGLTFLWTTLLLPLTLGWAWPWQRVKLQKILTDETRFGDREFDFDGLAAHLYKSFAILWVSGIVFFSVIIGLLIASQIDKTLAAFAGLLVPVGIIFLTIVGAWYRSKEYNYFAESTTFDAARFRLNATPGSLIGLILLNLLLTVVTFGIAMPIVQARLIRYFVTRLDIDGTVNVTAIAQAQDELTRTGEGLAEAFDIDMF